MGHIDWTVMTILLEIVMSHHPGVIREATAVWLVLSLLVCWLGGPVCWSVFRC